MEFDVGTGDAFTQYLKPFVAFCFEINISSTFTQPEVPSQSTTISKAALSIATGVVPLIYSKAPIEASLAVASTTSVNLSRLMS